MSRQLYFNIQESSQYFKTASLRKPRHEPKSHDSSSHESNQKVSCSAKVKTAAKNQDNRSSTVKATAKKWRELLFKSQYSSQNLKTAAKNSRHLLSKMSTELLFKGQESSRKVKKSALQKSGHQAKSQDCHSSKSKTATKNLSASLQKSRQLAKSQDSCTWKVKSADQNSRQFFSKVKTSLLQ